MDGGATDVSILRTMTQGHQEKNQRIKGAFLLIIGVRREEFTQNVHPKT